MRNFKRFFIVAVAVCMMVTMCPFMQDGISGSGHADAAAANGTPDAMTEFAYKCVSKSKSKLGLSGEWCARFVYYCAKNSGNASRVGTSIYVGSQAKQTVNDKGGTITFVNKAAYNACKGRFNQSRCKYNPNYVPKKGDIYIQKGYDYGDQYFAHTGIVRTNSSKSSIAYTIEGNTTCSDGKHKNYNYVEYKTRNKNTMSSPYGFSAFVTPRYSVNHQITFSLNGGKGSFKTINAKTDATFKLSKSKPSKSGYNFRGWYLKRKADNTWYVAGRGWCSWRYITKNKLSPKIYNPGKSYKIDTSWTNGSTASNYGFYAQWKKK